MADIIHLLPDSIANQIAAGEVIQRPSSVVKELLENSIDAGATRIDVLVVDAGRSCIQVIDNGRGMSETDARLAFERHATSKITNPSDLFCLRTMGFRGEALPSIAAVSQVTLRARTLEDDCGTCIVIEGGHLVSQQLDPCVEGCDIAVHNLFYNVPARRRFLRSNHTELSNIMQEMERVVLVNPDVHFSFSHNGNVLNTYPVSTLRKRISAVFGHKFGDALLPVDVETSLCTITGFVGCPASARKKGAHQFFFVNGRYMRHPYFHRAVQNAFEGLVAPIEQVPFFIYIQTDPSTIDVNIHPTKTEIKFENEQAIWQILSAAIRESLGRFNAVPVIDFDTEGRPGSIPVYSPSSHQPTPQISPSVDTSYNPFQQPVRQASSAPGNWQSLFPETELSPDKEALQRSGRHYQYRGQFIITETQGGLMLVDQHRAHIRILYNMYRKQLSSGVAPSQRLLFPEMVRFPASDASMLDALLPQLSSVGFDISPLGGGSYSVLALPHNISTLAPQSLFDELLSSLREGSKAPYDELHHRMALIMARSAAIPVGQELLQAEMETLLSELFETDNPNTTPDGHTIIALIPHKNIENMF